MPAPPVTDTSSLVVSEEVVVCAGFHSAADERSAAAVLIASSLVLMLVRSVLCCVTETWCFWTAVTLFCSIAINCWMTESVSRPEAMPLSETAMGGFLEVGVAGQKVQRVCGRDRLEHVAVEVPDLDDHAVGGGVRGEVQLAVARVQLVHDVRGVGDQFAGLRRWRRGNVSEDRP